MKLEELKIMMDKSNMSTYGYSINSEEQNEAYHIKKVEDGWHIYYMERGNRNSYGIFEKEGDAIRKFISLVKDFL